MKGYKLLMKTAACVWACVWACLVPASCILDTDYDAAPFGGKILPRATGYTTEVTNDWMYFNLRTGEVFNKTAPSQEIKEGEQYSRTDWDMAFCGYHIRTNSGTSGCGKGGAIDLGYGGYKNWTSVSQLPANAQWITDNAETVHITVSQADWYRYLSQNGLSDAEYPWFDPNSGPQRTLTSANPLLEENMALSGPPMTYTPSYHTYIIRTADGEHYFKLQVVSWYNTHTEIDDTGGELSYYVDELY